MTRLMLMIPKTQLIIEHITERILRVLTVCLSADFPDCMKKKIANAGTQNYTSSATYSY